MEANHSFQLEHIDGVIFLNGLIFIESSMIKKNDPMIQRTFQDLYKHVSSN